MSGLFRDGTTRSPFSGRIWVSKTGEMERGIEWCVMGCTCRMFGAVNNGLHGAPVRIEVWMACGEVDAAGGMQSGRGNETLGVATRRWAWPLPSR